MWFGHVPQGRRFRHTWALLFLALNHWIGTTDSTDSADLNFSPDLTSACCQVLQASSFGRSAFQAAGFRLQNTLHFSADRSGVNHARHLFAMFHQRRFVMCFP